VRGDIRGQALEARIIDLRIGWRLGGERGGAGQEEKQGGTHDRLLSGLTLRRRN
jgi:hypothetical protein